VILKSTTLSPLTIRILTFVLLIVLIGAVFQSLLPVYLTVNNMGALFRSMAGNLIVSIGLTFVIVTGKFDLSLAGTAALAAMTIGFALAKTGNLAAAIAAGMLISVAVGAVNGLLVGWGRLPDVVTTIGVGSIAYGAAFLYNGGATFSENFFSSGMVKVNIVRILYLQIPIFLAVVTTILAGLLLHMTRYGHSFYAAGENPVAARFSGISVPRLLIITYALCGTSVGLAMVLVVSSIGGARVTSGSQILLPAYASVYLGAALFGRPGVPATIAGALIMYMILNGLTLLNIPYYFSDVILSSILIAAIAFFDSRVLRMLKALRHPFVARKRALTS
jgi:ribose transport system permease protein